MEVVGPRTSLEALSENLRRRPRAIVLDGQDIAGIIAKSI